MAKKKTTTKKVVQEIDIEREAQEAKVRADEEYKKAVEEMDRED
jgi:hypothetical protein